MTGGLSDIGSLVDCLYGIVDGKTDLNILEKWCEIRREIYHSYIDPVSITNMKRLTKAPHELKLMDPFFQALTKAANDPALLADLRMVSHCPS